MRSNPGIVVLAGASIVSAVLGSIHAFSVFLEPLEGQFTATRSAVSLTYSLALLALTISVLLGPRFFGRWSAASIVLFACALAACGALLAGMAGSLAFVWLGYSLIFGLANGLGYGFGLQIAAQFNPGREGLAMGVVTAAYALGAVLSPALFSQLVEVGGFASAMFSLAAALIGAGVLSAILMKTVDARFRVEIHQSGALSVPVRIQRLLWLGYFGAVLAGLMVIGHAAGIGASLRPGTAVWLAPAIIAASNLLGSLIGGRLADWVRPGILLATLAVLTTLAVAGIAAFGHIGGLMAGLGVVGFAYGGTIAAYPAAIAKLFGMRDSARIYGRIFTAWGCAGLIGPWFAGVLFDWSGGYQLALLAAAAFGLISVTAVIVLFGKYRLTAE
jgi:OFA family oxalate/formate antiporter-like MFS transporter